MSDSRPKVIVADADRFIRESMCLGLGEGFDMVQASNGAEAICAFKESGADAIVLAHSREVDAVEVCRALRSMKKGGLVPIYVLGDDDEEAVAFGAFEAGASDYLIKPVHLGFFARRISRDLYLAEKALASGVGSLEKAQVESELFRLLPEPAILLGAHGVIMMANQAFERVCDLKAAILGHLITDLLKSFDLRQALADGIADFDMDCGKRGVILVRLKCVRLLKGPWRDCVLCVFAERTPDVATEPVAATYEANILVLEDYDVVARSLKRLLERAGHKVNLAATSDDACKLVSQASGAGGRFDLAILDVSIPGSAGGGDVLKSLRAIQPDLRAIVTSGSWHDPAMNHPSDFGFDATLRKPFSREELLNVVNRVIGKK
jgi:DNA-binding response OmpR family regulator